MVIVAKQIQDNNIIAASIAIKEKKINTSNEICLSLFYCSASFGANKSLSVYKHREVEIVSVTIT